MKIDKEANFEQSVIIKTIQKRYSVFIQTDKAIYKPNDTVQYRVIVLDQDTKPYEVKKLDVLFYDGNGNKVPVVDDSDTDKTAAAGESDENNVDSDESNSGETKASHEELLYVHKGKLELHTEPVEGNWTISVKVNDDESVITKKNFEVKEYILPRFEVIVSGKSHVIESDKVYRLTVSANYTFGEFVRGQAVITSRTYDTLYPDIIQHTAKITVPVGLSRKMVEFNMKTGLGIHNTIHPMKVDFDVEFEETKTGQKLRPVTFSVRVHKFDDVTLELQRDKKKFKPGYPYRIQAVVRKLDGTLEMNRVDPVKFKINYFYSILKCTNRNLKYLSTEETDIVKGLKNGIAVLTLTVPENTTAVTISAVYQENAKATLGLTRFVSNSREYIFATVKGK